MKRGAAALMRAGHPRTIAGWYHIDHQAISTATGHQRPTRRIHTWLYELHGVKPWVTTRFLTAGEYLRDTDRYTR